MLALVRHHTETPTVFESLQQSGVCLYFFAVSGVLCVVGCLTNFVDKRVSVGISSRVDWTWTRLAGVTRYQLIRGVLIDDKILLQAFVTEDAPPHQTTPVPFALFAQALLVCVWLGNVSNVVVAVSCRRFWRLKLSNESANPSLRKLTLSSV